MAQIGVELPLSVKDYEWRLRLLDSVDFIVCAWDASLFAGGIGELIQTLQDVRGRTAHPIVWRGSAPIWTDHLQDGLQIGIDAWVFTQEAEEDRVLELQARLRQNGRMAGWAVQTPLAAWPEASGDIVMLCGEAAREIRAPRRRTVRPLQARCLHDGSNNLAELKRQDDWWVLDQSIWRFPDVADRIAGWRNF
ncbi:MAG: hypothetical protein OWS74_01060 [Firmicutes bacterium]|nr:hypothetical protein [Bacillota bacterium]